MNERDLLDSLYNIVGDLWRDENGTIPAKADPRRTEIVTENKTVKETAETIHDAKPAAKEEEKAPAMPDHPALEKLFSYADQVIDWTDALVKETPDDGVTSAKLWSFYHSKAQGILNGDVDTYREVLSFAQPLLNIQDYSLWMTAAVKDSETLTANFEAEPFYMKPDEQKKYLSAVSLRMARDLFALLPVNTVQVSATQSGTELLSISWQRKELQKLHFAFADTEELAERCGAEWKL